VPISFIAAKALISPYAWPLILFLATANASAVPLGLFCKCAF
jgi:hypothetical protein